MTLKETKYLGYFVSDEGKVYSIKRAKEKDAKGNLIPKELGYRTNGNGYINTCLRIKEDGQRKKIMPAVHRLIYETFNGEVPQGLVVDHINGDKYDNRLCNLRAIGPYANSTVFNSRAGVYEVIDHISGEISLMFRREVCATYGMTHGRLDKINADKKRYQYVHDGKEVDIEISFSMDADMRKQARDRYVELYGLTA